MTKKSVKTDLQIKIRELAIKYLATNSNQVKLFIEALEDLLGLNGLNESKRVPLKTFDILGANFKKYQKKYGETKHFCQDHSCPLCFNPANYKELK